MGGASEVGVGGQPLLDPGEPFGLGVQGVLEGQRFVAVPCRELVLGVGAVDRVAQDRDQAGLGKRRSQSLGDGRVEQVIGARLAGDDMPAEPPGTSLEMASEGKERR